MKFAKISRIILSLVLVAVIALSVSVNVGPTATGSNGIVSFKVNTAVAATPKNSEYRPPPQKIIKGTTTYVGKLLNTSRTDNASSSTSNWTNPTNAYADGGGAATVTSGSPSVTQEYGNYGIVIAGNIVTQVRVRLDAWTTGTSSTNITREATSDNANTGGFTSTNATRYQAINDSSDSSYITGVTNGGGYATFGYTAFAVAANSTITNVAVYYRHRSNTTGTAANSGTVLTVGGTAYGLGGTLNAYTDNGTSSEPASTSAIADRTYLWTINPKSGVAWTVDDVNGSGTNALQFFGVGGSDFNPDVNFYKCNITVNYTTAANENIELDVTWDGGTTWSSSKHSNPTTGSEVTYWDNVTSDTTWTAAKLTDANFKTRVDALTVGDVGTMNLDWIPVEVTYITLAPPSSFTSTSRTSSSIALSWVKGDGADNTTIRYRTDQYPTGTSDGTLGYSGTGTSTNITSLSAGQIYYFRAWSYNNAEATYSTSYSDLTDYTLPGNPSGLTSGSQTDNSVALSWTGGTGGDKTLVRYKEGSYPSSTSDGTEGYFNTGTSANITGLSPGVTYYFRSWAYDSDSTYYSSGTSDLTQATTGVGWLSGYTYRKQINITGASTNQTNYQLPLYVHNGDTKDTAIYTYTGGADDYQINYPFQRHVFRAAGLIWIFYSKMTDGGFVYVTSADGVNLSGETTVLNPGTGAGAHAISYAVSGTTIVYSRDSQINGQSHWFRQGTLNTDGTITWTAAEQTIATAPLGTDSYWYTSIIVDDSGHAWVGTMLNHNGTNYDAVVTRNDNTDGTWSTTAGFPYTLASGATAGYIIPHGVALTGGKVYWMYIKEYGASAVFGKPYDAGWGAEETLSTYSAAGNAGSLVSEGDIVKAYYADGGYTINYNQRSAAGAWSGQENPVLSGNPSEWAALTQVGTNDVILTYLDTVTKHIYYLERKNGSWLSRVDWLDESAEGFRAYIELNVIPNSSGPVKLLAAYETNTVSPFHLKSSVIWQDSGNHVTISGKGKTDFSDVHFTQSNGTSELDYWQETYTSNVSELAWIEYNTLTASVNNVFYMYYGNAGASSSSNGTNTFIFFDDFPGSSLDTTTNWNTSNSPTISVSGGSVTITSSADAWRGIVSQSTYAAGKRFRSRASMVHGQAYYNNMGLATNLNTVNSAVFYWGTNSAEPNDLMRTYDASAGTDYAITGDASTHTRELDWTASLVDFYIDNRYQTESTTHLPTGPLNIQMAVYDNPNSQIVADWVFLGLYVSPEPTWGTWGAEEPSLTNTPTTKSFGLVSESSTYYAKGSAPSNPVVDGDCTFTITNTSNIPIDIVIKGSAFTGGVGWTLTSGSPGSNTVRIKAYYSGQNPASGVTLTTSDQSFLSNLGISATKMWDFSLETGTFTDGVAKSGTITLTASAHY